VSRIESIDHEDLEFLVSRSYKTKDPLFVYGSFGIGKSMTVKRKAKEISEKKDKEFVEWNEVPKERKQELIENPEDYFVLVDIRLAQMDASDIKGIPNIENNGAVEWKPPLWVYFGAQENADGIFFFDEANLAPPIIQSAFYQVVHDKQSGAYKINDNIGMISAGNRVEDKSNVYDLSEALKDRYNIVELTPPSLEMWTEWASSNGIDDRVILFLQNHRSKLNDPAKEDSKQKSATPRAWERVSNNIKGVEDPRKIRMLAASSVGERIAIEFKNWIETRENINTEKFLSEPDSAELPDDPSKIYALISELVSYYKENTEKKSKKRKRKRKKVFNSLLKVGRRLANNGDSIEFAPVLFKLMMKEDKRYFVKHAGKNEDWNNAISGTELKDLLKA